MVKCEVCGEEDREALKITTNVEDIRIAIRVCEVCYKKLKKRVGLYLKSKIR